MDEHRMDDVELVYVADLERRLRVSRDAVRAMVRRGELPRPAKLGRRSVWRREDIDQWLAEKFDAA